MPVLPERQRRNKNIIVARTNDVSRMARQLFTQLLTDLSLSADTKLIANPPFGRIFPGHQSSWSLMRQADESGRLDVLDDLMANARTVLQNTSACLLNKCRRD